jgi:methylmalonyl-CoA mutase C-terminal domain/subunit
MCKLFHTDRIIHPIERGIITTKHIFGGMMSETEKKIRVLIAKPGLDGHDRGAKVVARALRDAGMEVIYTGLRQTPEMIAEAALQEDVDVVGLSILSGAHMALAPRVIELLKANGQDHVKVFLGGIIPDEDINKLQEIGVTGIYGPGTMTDDIVGDVRRGVLGEVAN